MEQKCKYNVTLKQCKDKWEAPCDGDDHRCELQNTGGKNNHGKY